MDSMPHLFSEGTRRLITSSPTNVGSYASNLFSTQVRCLSSTVKQTFSQNAWDSATCSTSLLRNSLKKLLVPNQSPTLQCRTVTKYSLSKGKRKTVKAVIKKFFRLDWGIWIRRRSGCHKRLWMKSAARKRRLKQHVFTNSTQSWMLDKMVTKFWKRRKYYVDDPYEPYHTREEFWVTRKKPRPLEEY
ncbi:hypothetical protein QAD02_022037 [Eretmocerus hayati]|uniref:Uncharacterized protein n=1 Tax=Eretmocerus hayati TaxID=131215 RepID=A0ACC2PRY1_9HYME|nr:hypothetical protein QAD02_022037 [Eretmocerus hayati]